MLHSEGMLAVNPVNGIRWSKNIMSNHKNASTRGASYDHTAITKTDGALTDIHPIGMACMVRGARSSGGTDTVQFRDSQILPVSTLLKVSNRMICAASHSQPTPQFSVLI